MNKFKEEDLVRPLKTLDVHTHIQSFPIPHKRVMNAYEKGQFFCVVVLNKEGKREVFKYPIASIFRVREDYD
jgi:hypothetical protein